MLKNSKYFSGFFSFSAQKFKGLIGQLFALLAMLVPIVSGDFDAIGFLLVASAIANFFVIPGSLACGHIVPSLKSRMRVSVLVRGALCITVAGLVISILSSFLVGLYFGEKYALIGIFSAIFTGVQVIYALALALLVRSREEVSIFSLRFRYGWSLFVLTLGTVMIGGGGEGLTSAYIFATLFSISTIRVGSNHLVVHKLVDLVLGMRFIHIFLFKRQISIYWPVVLGNLISTAAFHVTTLSIGSAGVFTAVWSVTLRLVGGVGTTVTQLVAPGIEGHFAENFRMKLFASAEEVQFRALKLGLIIGLFTCVVVTVGFGWVVLQGEFYGNDYWIFLASAYIFSFAIGVGAITSKLSGLCGAGHGYLLLALAKIVLGAAVLAFFSGLQMIFFLAMLEFVYQSLQFILVRKKIRLYQYD